ncbi:uncharacterized protein LOC143154892 isoform X1 [Ptiloglossa arizonensis]|uniref:uncharacterized protein LOC143154892 isoform X1 n=1 Tax=Ptiloglossa arizonensis TaxID=3350558 RepID=UPI003F9F5BFF
MRYPNLRNYDVCPETRRPTRLFHERFNRVWRHVGEHRYTESLLKTTIQGSGKNVIHGVRPISANIVPTRIDDSWVEGRSTEFSSNRVNETTRRSRAPVTQSTAHLLADHEVYLIHDRYQLNYRVYRRSRTETIPTFRN